MKVGTAQLEITPQPGIDLTGFAVRQQPSTAVLDSLWIRALYLEDGNERLLWLHADLLAFGQLFAERLRRRVEKESGIPFFRIVISATHTHGGPAAIQLTNCGEINPAYAAWLEQQVSLATRSALKNSEPCRLIVAEGRCELGVDRRRTASPHTDPRVGTLGWCRSDGTFKAVFVSYAMHPVSLRCSQISADWPGETARVLSDSLPGGPVVLVSSGACGNINPPAADVTPPQMQQWGRQVAESARVPLLAAAGKAELESSLKVISAPVPLPKEDWEVEQIEQCAATNLADPAGGRAFGKAFESAVETWRDKMIKELRNGDSPFIQAELCVVSFGPVTIVTVNGEIFSQFNELIRSKNGPSVYTAGCSNGMIGYVAPADAYAEGGYEVSWSMFFYNLPRPRKGGLELLAQHARQLLAACHGPAGQYFQSRSEWKSDSGMVKPVRAQ